MKIVRASVTFTKEEVECIKSIGEICSIFDFNPWEVLEAVENGYGLGEVDFIYED